MTFESELQALVDKYRIGEVSITYKRTVTLSANPVTDAQKPPAPAFVADEEEANDALRKYTDGPVGRVA